MMPTELETEYMALMQRAHYLGEHSLTQKRMRELLADPDATDTMLVHGLLAGSPGAWEHPDTQLLWLACAGSLRHLQQIARTLPRTQYQLSGVTVAAFSRSCGPGELLKGLRLAYNHGPIPAQLEPVKRWLLDVMGKAVSVPGVRR